MPYESVFYGPLLFALAIPDKDPNTPVAGCTWQYALDNEAQRGGADMHVERRRCRRSGTGRWTHPLTITVPAKTFDWRPTDDPGVAPAPVEGIAAETIRLIPYGCTKFRSPCSL